MERAGRDEDGDQPLRRRRNASYRTGAHPCGAQAGVISERPRSTHTGSDFTGPGAPKPLGNSQGTSEERAA